MSSISNIVGRVNGVSVLRLGAYGLMEKTTTGLGQPAHLRCCQRGKISGFSSGSARRLREALFSKYVPGSISFGATFTVPWKCSSEEERKSVVLRFESTFNRWRKRFNYDFPRSSIIYRVELQRRGAPHLHAVCYISGEDVKTSIEYRDIRQAQVALSQCQLRDEWLFSFDNATTESEWRRANSHSVKFDSLDTQNKGSLFRYLADHTSKSKQAQLGWKGRQWGILGRNNLVSENLFDLPPFPDSHSQGVFWRMIKKLTRYRISDELRTKKWKRRPPFGSVYKGGNRKRGVIFVKGGGDAVLKCYHFAVSQSHH